MRGSPPYFEPVGNAAVVMSFTSYSPGPEITNGCLSPRPASSEPFMSAWLNEMNATSAPKFVGLKFLELLETGPNTSVVSPACARMHAPSWKVRIISNSITKLSFTFLHFTLLTRAPSKRTLAASRATAFRGGRQGRGEFDQEGGWPCIG